MLTSPFIDSFLGANANEALPSGSTIYQLKHCLTLVCMKNTALRDMS